MACAPSTGPGGMLAVTNYALLKTHRRADGRADLRTLSAALGAGAAGAGAAARLPGGLPLRFFGCSGVADAAAAAAAFAVSFVFLLGGDVFTRAGGRSTPARFFVAFFVAGSASAQRRSSAESSGTHKSSADQAPGSWILT